MRTKPFTICLWYKANAEEAANFYTSIFKNSSIGNITRFGKEGFEFHGIPEGTVMTMEFMLNDMNFLALNGNQKSAFTPATSIMLTCDTQEEIDYYWDALCSEGQEEPCGWLKDKFGMSWQIVPAKLGQWMANTKNSQEVTTALMGMKKIDMNVLTEINNR